MKYDRRQVFWLSDQTTHRAFSDLPRRVTSHDAAARMALLRLSSPITAAGPRWIRTTFPSRSVHATKHPRSKRIHLSIRDPFESRCVLFIKFRLHVKDNLKPALYRDETGSASLCGGSLWNCGHHGVYLLLL